MVEHSCSMAIYAFSFSRSLSISTKKLVNRWIPLQIFKLLCQRCCLRDSSHRNKLEQLERLNSEDNPAASWLPILLSHTGSQVKRRQSQSYKFKEFAKTSNFWILKQTVHDTHLLMLLDKMCNKKWIWRVLLKIQSGHDSVHRRTRWNQYTPLSTLLSGGGYKNRLHYCKSSM